MLERKKSQPSPNIQVQKEKQTLVSTKLSKIHNISLKSSGAARAQSGSASVRSRNRREPAQGPGRLRPPPRRNYNFWLQSQLWQRSPGLRAQLIPRFGAGSGVCVRSRRTDSRRGVWLLCSGVDTPVQCVCVCDVSPRSNTVWSVSCCCCSSAK